MRIGFPSSTEGSPFEFPEYMRMCPTNYIHFHLQIQHSLAHADLQLTQRISARRHEHQHSALHAIHFILDACQHINLLLSLRPPLGLDVSQGSLCQ